MMVSGGIKNMKKTIGRISWGWKNTGSSSQISQMARDTHCSPKFWWKLRELGNLRRFILWYLIGTIGSSGLGPVKLALWNLYYIRKVFVRILIKVPQQDTLVSGKCSYIIDDLYYLKLFLPTTQLDKWVLVCIIFILSSRQQHRSGQLAWSHVC